MGKTACAALVVVVGVFACLMGGCGGESVAAVPAAKLIDPTGLRHQPELHFFIGTTSETTANPSAEIAGTPGAEADAWPSMPEPGLWDSLRLGEWGVSGWCGVQEALSVSDGGTNAPGLEGTW